MPTRNYTEQLLTIPAPVRALIERGRIEAGNALVTVHPPLSRLVKAARRVAADVRAGRRYGEALDELVAAVDGLDGPPTCLHGFEWSACVHAVCVEHPRNPYKR